MRRATKRRVQLFLRLLLVGTLIRVAYGGLIGLTFRGTALINRGTALSAPCIHL
jgi:hypothetical protein